jgi:hypothetical protein
MKNWQLSKRILFIALVPVWAIMILLTVLVVVVGITEIDGALKARGALITRHLAPPANTACSPAIAKSCNRWRKRS